MTFQKEKEVLKKKKNEHRVHVKGLKCTPQINSYRIA